MAYRADDDVLMVTATQIVLVDLDERKACPIPDAFVETVRAFEGDDVELAR